jgi:hypothetical protein
MPSKPWVCIGLTSKIGRPVTGWLTTACLFQPLRSPQSRQDEIWLSKQKSARTRRAYRLDVQHFMRTLSIDTAEELHQADYKAVIAEKRYDRACRLVDDPPASRSTVVALVPSCIS